MTYRIYQIRNMRNCRYAFEDYDSAKDYFDLNDYDEVYSGQFATSSSSSIDVLEELFYKFNVKRPDDFKGHSLSVSDVVELNNSKYYVDALGWKKLD